MGCLGVLILLSAAAAVLGQITLPQYNINPSTVTVSGVSSGGCMAHQYHVINSGEIAGVAIFAGIVYRCAEGSSLTGISCTSSPGLVNVNFHENEARDSAAAGEVDAVSGMFEDKVYIFQSVIDTVVAPGNGDNIQKFYNDFGASVKYETTIAAAHCQPTDYYGPSCDTKGGEYINDCSFNGAYEALNYMLGGLTQPDNLNTPLPGLYTQFDQVEFFGDTHAASMDDFGYLYVPSGCQDGSTQCDLHVVFHGCQQGRQALGNDNFVRNTGYLQSGEVNNIIMLFPQVITKTLDNPQGCWDWWGYTGGGLYAYAKNTGVQPMGIRAMIQRLLYGV